MAIQPIDLQTMYSQMSHVANKVNHENQTVQNNLHMQQESAIKEIENSLNSVNRTADNDTQTVSVNENGKQNQSEENPSKNENKKNNSDEESKKKIELSEDYLGKHINITR